MQDELVDAPQLELTAEPAAGEDALQLGPSDSPASAANLGDAFSIKNKRPKPEPSPPMKVAKAVTAQANDSVVAALMGLKLPSVKPQPKPRVEPTVQHEAPDPEPQPEPESEFEPQPEFNSEVEVPFEQTFVAHEESDELVASDRSVEFDSSVRYAAAQAADPTDESADAPADAPIAAPAPMLRLVYPPLEDDSVIEAEAPSTEVQETIAVEAPEVVEQPAASTDPLPNLHPAYRETGPEETAPSTPKPKRAIPVAPQWPSEPPPARPKRQAIRPSAPAEIPTPPVHIVPAARIPAAQPRTSPPTSAVPMEPAGPTGAWWTIPLTFVGIAIVACAILIPASDENRRANYELAKIEQDVNYFERQSAVNKDFIERVNTDATLAERLAQRQLHQTRQGVKIAPMSGKPAAFASSPFAMTHLDAPQPLPAYQPVNDILTDWFLGEERSQQMAAIGLVVAGAGVMLGGRGRRVA